jgi:hypothetical protein
VISKHARFESLYGAIVLDEATQAERDEYARHAADCALCDDETTSGALLAAIAAERDTETWRPSVDRRVVTRIREMHSKHSRFTVGLLGWAAAASIAVNVFFVTGFAGRVGSAVFDAMTPPAPVADTQFGVRLPAQTFATVKRRAVPERTVVAIDHAARASVRRHHVAAAASLPQRGPVRRSPAAANDVPDIFAGTDLAVHNANAPRAVAIESHPLNLSP